MAIAKNNTVGSRVVDSPASSGDITHTINLSSSNKTGRLLLVHVGVANGAGYATGLTVAGSSATEVTGCRAVQTVASIEYRSTMFWIVDESSDSSTSFVIQGIGTGSNVDTSIIVWEFTGADNSSPIGATANRANGGGSNNDQTYSLVTTAANSYIVCGLWGLKHPGSPASGITEDIDGAAGTNSLYWGGSRAAATATTYTVGCTVSNYFFGEGGASSALEVLEDAGTPTVTGTISATIGNFTQSASGTLTISGTVSSTLADFVSAFSGTIGNSGTIAPTIADFVSAISGNVGITGTVSSTLADFVSSFSGTIGNTGTVASTLANFTSNISGQVAVFGSLSSTLENFVPNIQGAMEVFGTIEETLENFTSSMEGSYGISGSINSTLEPFTGTFSGTLTISGTMAPTLEDFQFSSDSYYAIGGTISVTLSDFVSDIEAAEIFSGAVSSTLDNFVSNIAAKTGPAGIISTTIGPLTMEVNSNSGVTITGTIRALLGNVV